MGIDEIIRRLERLAGRAVHVKGEPPFAMSLDDGIALSEAVSLIKTKKPEKPVIDTYFYRCAKCGCALCGRTITAPDNNRLRPNHCSECGQAVNWQL